ncbi:asparagine synthetase B family protein [Sphingomonas sp. 22R3R2A-7]|uniref:asparagine synthetase B family protein n=1 Tax=Sphingomonas sp. 22R3R2A-7 TaxID=3050230 RepID=UPI002FE393C4
MTALYGLCRWDGGIADRDLPRMAAALRRFGRSGSDHWTAGSIALGIARHALLPEDEHVPEIHERGRRYAVVADVHLSERESLVAQLDLDAQTVALLSDAALVAAAVERWDEAAFDRIYGAFAVAAWDTHERRLILARDPLGARPLFYHATDDLLAFASMPEGLTVLPAVDAGMDTDQYVRLLRDLAPERDRTPLRGISRVMPGHHVIVRKDGIDRVRWWKPDLTPLILADQDDYAAALTRHLEEAVKACLRGVSGCVGAQLSSGFDSSAVLAVAASQLARRSGDAGPVKITAFTAVPRSDRHTQVLAHHIADEGDLAAEVAASLPNVDHVRVSVDHGTLDTLGRTSGLYPLPIRNLCNLTWVDAIADAARARGLTIMLQGGMGNMTLSEPGVLALQELIAAGRFPTWFRIARGLVRNGWMQWRGVLWNSVAGKLPERVWRFMETRSGRAPIATRRFTLLRDAVYDHAGSIARETATADPYTVIDVAESAQPVATSVQNRLAIASADIGSLHKAQLGEWGIDTRDPTGDRRLMEFALRVPVERLIWDGEPRAILRRAIAGRLPASIVDNRRRGLQSADWHEGLIQSRSALIDEIERIEMYDPVASLIDIDRLKALVADMPDLDSPRWQEGDTEVDYRLTLLRTVSIASHMRRVSRSNV